MDCYRDYDVYVAETLANTDLEPYSFEDWLKLQREMIRIEKEFVEAILAHRKLEKELSNG